MNAKIGDDSMSVTVHEKLDTILGLINDSSIGDLEIVVLKTLKATANQSISYTVDEDFEFVIAFAEGCTYGGGSLTSTVELKTLFNYTYEGGGGVWSTLRSGYIVNPPIGESISLSTGAYGGALIIGIKKNSL